MVNFLNAFRFLTIIPVPLRTTGDKGDIGASLGFFPLVGLLIGLLLAGIDYSLSYILPRNIVTGLVIVSLIVITGALHLDGFIDSIDGIFIGDGPEKRLAVMKDSRVGSFGVIGAILLILLKYLSLDNLTEFDRLLSLILMPVLSRWCVIWPIYLFPYARPTGLGTVFKSRATWYRLIVPTIFTLAVSIAIFKFKGIIIMAGLCIVTLLTALFVNRRLSGLTGDSYGALIETGDLYILIMILILSSATF